MTVDRTAIFTSSIARERDQEVENSAPCSFAEVVEFFALRRRASRWRPRPSPEKQLPHVEDAPVEHAAEPFVRHCCVASQSSTVHSASSPYALMLELVIVERSRTPPQTSVPNETDEVLALGHSLELSATCLVRLGSFAGSPVPIFSNGHGTQLRCKMCPIRFPC